MNIKRRNFKGSFTGSFLIYVLVFLLIFPVFLMFSSLWSYMQPILIAQTTNGIQAYGGNSIQATNMINQIGNNFFYHIPDSMIILLYFGLIGALFLSVLYESANPAALPIGILFLIPLIILSFPLSDLTHFLYLQPGFSNVIQYYPMTIYISDWSPLFTTLFTLGYILFAGSRRKVFNDSPSGPNTISG